MADLIPLAHFERGAEAVGPSAGIALTGVDLAALCHAVRCLDDLVGRTPCPVPGHADDLCDRRRRAVEALAPFDLAEPGAQKEARRAS